MGDINLNGNSDGVRMTWPRAASLVVVLLLAGGMWARVEFRMDLLEKQRADERVATDKRIDKLTDAVEDLARMEYRGTAPLPRIDSQGRILK